MTAGNVTCQAMTHEFGAADEAVHPEAICEEWVFSWWAADASIAGWSMYRLVPKNLVWYCFGLVGRDRPLLHVAEFDISRRADPMIAKAESFWAEFVCDAPFEQWTLGNETYAVELDDPDEGLGRAYGRVVPVASDLEWYATAAPSRLAGPLDSCSGYEQHGVVLGVVETEHGTIDIPEIAAHRVHRWSDRNLDPFVPTLGTKGTEIPVGGDPLRLAFRFPDGGVWDAVLTVDGFRAR